MIQRLARATTAIALVAAFIAVWGFCGWLEHLGY